MNGSCGCCAHLGIRSAFIHTTFPSIKLKCESQLYGGHRDWPEEPSRNLDGQKQAAPEWFQGMWALPFAGRAPCSMTLPDSVRWFQQTLLVGPEVQEAEFVGATRNVWPWQGSDERKSRKGFLSQLQLERYIIGKNLGRITTQRHSITWTFHNKIVIKHTAENNPALAWICLDDLRSLLLL